MRRTIGFLLAGALCCGILAGCGSSDDQESGEAIKMVILDNWQGTQEPEDAAATEAETDAPDAGGVNSFEEREAQETPGLSAEDGSLPESSQPEGTGRMAAYAAALEGIYVDHVFPDGRACDSTGGDEMSQNKFAVADVDFDGEQELIIVYTTASMAGMGEYIYDYDPVSGKLREEFYEFPLVEYYDNGYIEAEASHNHGMAPDLDDFWPYGLYRYEQESDTYVLLNLVDAWHRTYAEKDYMGNPFPDEIDEDGDGIVYYLMSEDGETEMYLDKTAYEQWRAQWLDGAKKLEIPYLSMTRENIDSFL